MKMETLTVCVKKGAQRDLADRLAGKLDVPLTDTPGEQLTVLFDASGVSLCGYGLNYQGDFSNMLYRVTDGRLLHEMLVRAAKTDKKGLRAVDATAGMGEDSFLLAAYGYEVTMCEKNPVIAALLKDALRRAAKQPALKEIIRRMNLVEGDSIEFLADQTEKADLIYLDPMFPERQKSGLTNKKLQLIQKMEPPCGEEEALFAAAISAKPSKIIVKRPLKSPYLAGRKPNYTLNGKAIRYDCY
jgi:16S rRNA (guanine1516-N2)-methyltransferase